MLSEDTCDTMALRLGQILQCHCARLNKFLKKKTLSTFANEMCSCGLITPDLRDDPAYNEIEGQFIALLEIRTTKEEFEKDCKHFLGALKGEGGPLTQYCDKIGKQWRDEIYSEFSIRLDI